MTTTLPGTMRALRYHARPVPYLLAGALGKRAPSWLPPLRLERVPVPEAPAGWRRVDVRLTGVCGSDLSLLYGTGSPRLSPFFSYPAVLGHEVLGEVEGTRVVIDPVIACADRGFPPCPACARGDDQRCANVAEGAMAPGLIGYNRDLPGGWSERLIARDARLHPVPDRVPDERAVLAEPFAVAWRGVRLALEHGAGRTLLVVGSGSIGLLTVAAARRAGYTGELHAIARYDRQAELARAAGADRVHRDMPSASASVGGRSYRAILGPPAWRGGFDTVIEAAGSRSSIADAMWAVREGGTVVLVGAAGKLPHDFAPHWFREVQVVGSYVYTPRQFREAFDELAHVRALDGLLSRRAPLERYREVLADLRSRRGLKIAFDPRA